MFNKDFYPTPKNIIELMLQDIDILNNNFLEPSAGKGDIVNYLNERGAKQVVAFEKNKDLQKILSGKAKLLGDDFLECTAEQVSHINYIVMNPPFSADEKHIIHAYEVAPEGCEIIALCNSDTLRKRFSRDRKSLFSLVEDYGNEESLGSVFSQAERKTNIEVSLVHIYKPMLSEGMDFNGFYLEEEEINEGVGLIKHSEIRNVVESYVKAVKCFDKLTAISSEMKDYTTVTDFGKFGEGCVFSMSHNSMIVTKEEFAKELQKHCWNQVFRKMNISKYVTSGVMRDINAFVENQTKIPFTLKNIYRMAQILVGTSQNTMNRAIVEAVDSFTKHVHENRYGVEGWKTNAGHLLNKKIIIPYIVRYDEWGDNLELRGSCYKTELEDLHKVLCYLKGVNYDKQKTLQSFFWEIKVSPGQWHSWSFFEFKAYKKGTMHLKFQDEKDWEILNRAYAKVKGAKLPEKM